MTSDNIKVAIRVRQLIQKEYAAGAKSHWSVQDSTSICCNDYDNGRKPTPYTFDRVFDEQDITVDVFEDVCKPIVDSAVAGFHGTIFAYGQSSSGKTFTMSGSRNQPGIIPLAVEEIFNSINNIPDKEFLIRVGYLEIYNEKVTDLLSTEDVPIKLQEDTDHNIQVAGMNEEMVNTSDKVFEVLKRGDVKRHVAETKQNDRSSRSHCILRFVIESRMMGNEEEAVNVSHLNFVDLAGSEKAGDNSGDRFREGCSINKSLLNLGNVIRKLSGDNNLQHVSFRDSKLTRILQNALGGNSRTAIICTITPAAIDESDSTLKFASRAKSIQNKAHVNEVMSDAALMKKYRRQINLLTSRLDEMDRTDAHTEKAELEKKLREKEEVEHRQMDMIAKLQGMIVTSGSAANSAIEEPPKKKRRETWCPGKGQRLLHNKFGSVSPPRFPAAFDRNVTFKPVAEADDSFQLLENIAPPMAITEKDMVFDGEQETTNLNETIGVNPVLKDLFQLQDQYETLREELNQKDTELCELQEFTTYEREVEAETIKELRQKVETSVNNSANVIWLEEELMKAEQERNGLRNQVDSLKHNLSAVEDGTGLSEKSKQLSESESSVASLRSDMDIQKAKYEFHIEQMKKRIESYTQMLEDKGVDSDIIKQKLTIDICKSEEQFETEVNYQQTIEDLRNEVDTYVQQLERENIKNCELVEHHDEEFEYKKQQFLNDIKEAREESDIYRQLYEELEKTRNSDGVGENLSENVKFVRDEPVSNVNDELEAQKLMYENQISNMKAEIISYRETLDRQICEHSENNGEAISDSPDLECMTSKLKSQEQDITKLKAEVETYIELLNVEKARFEVGVHDEQDTGNVQSHVETLESECLAKSCEHNQEASDFKSKLEQVTEAFNLYKRKVEQNAAVGENNVLNEILRAEMKAQSDEHAQEIADVKDKLEYVSGLLKTTAAIELARHEKQMAEEEITTLKTDILHPKNLLDTGLNLPTCNINNTDTDIPVQLETKRYKKEVACLKNELHRATVLFNESTSGTADESSTEYNADTPDAEVLKAMESEMSESDGEIAALKLELDRVTGLLNKYESANQTETSPTNNNDALQMELLRAETQSEKVKSVEEIATLKLQLEQVTGLLNEYRSANQTDPSPTDTRDTLQMELLIAEMESEMSNSGEEIATLKLQLEHVTGLLNEHKCAHETDTLPVSNNDTLQMELLRAEMESEMSKSYDEIATLKLQLEQVTGLLNEHKSAHQTDTLPVSNNDTLQMELLRAEMESEMSKSYDEIASLKLQLEQVTGLLNDYKSASHTDPLPADMRDTLQMELLRAEMESEMSKSDEEIATLKLQLEQVTGLLNDYKSASQTEPLPADTRDTLQMELLRAEMESEMSKSDEEIATLKLQLEQVTGLLNDYKSASQTDPLPADMRDTLQMELLRAEMESEMSKSDEEIATLKLQLEQVTGLLNDYKSASHTEPLPADTRDTLQMELLRAEMESEMSKSDEEIATLKLQLEQVIGLLNDYKSASQTDPLPADTRDTLQMELLRAEMESEMSKSDEEIATLKLQLEQVTGLLNDYKSASHTEPLPADTRDTLQMELLRAEMESEMSKSDEEIATLKLQLEHVTGLLNDYNSARQTVPLPADTRDTLQMELLRAEMESEMSKSDEEIATLKLQLEQVTGLLNEYKSASHTDPLPVDTRDTLQMELLRAEMESEMSKSDEEIATLKLQLEQVTGLLNDYKSASQTDPLPADTTDTLQMELLRAEMESEMSKSDEEIATLKLQLEQVTGLLNDYKSASQTDPLPADTRDTLQMELLRAEMESEMSKPDEEIATLKLQLEQVTGLLNDYKSASHTDPLPADTRDTLQMELLRAEMESEMSQSGEEIATLKLQLEQVTGLLNEYKSAHETDTLPVSNKDTLQMELPRAEMENEMSKSVAEIATLKLQLEHVTGLLNDYKSANQIDPLPTDKRVDDLQIELLKAEVESEKANFIEEITTLKLDLENVTGLLNDYKCSDQDDNLSTDNGDTLQIQLLRAEMESEKAKSDEEIATLKNELERITESFNELKFTIQDKFHVGNEESVQIELLKAGIETKISNYEEEIRTLTSELELTAERINELKSKYEILPVLSGNVAERQNSDASENPKCNEEITNLQQELEYVRIQFIEYKSKTELEKVKFTEEITKLNSEPHFRENITQEKFVSIQTELHRSEMNTEKAKHEEEMCGLRTELETYIQRVTSAATNESDLDIEKYETEINELKAKVDTLMDLLDTPRSNADHEEMTVNETNQTTHESQNVDYKKEIENLKCEIAALQTANVSTIHGDSSVDEVDNEHFRVRLDEAVKQNNQLEAEHMKERQTFSEHRALYETTMQETQEELHGVRDDVQKLSMEIERLQRLSQTLRKRSDMADQHIHEMESTTCETIDKLKKEFAEKVSTVLAEKDNMESELEVLTNAKLELEQELFEMNEHLAQVDVKSDQLQKEHSANISSMLAEQTKLQTDFETVSKEQIELEIRLSAVTKERFTFEQTVSDVLTEKANLQTELHETRRELEGKLTETINDKSTLSENATKLALGYEEQIEQMETERTRLQDELTLVNKTKVELEDKLSQMSADRSTVGKEADKLRMEYDERMVKVELEKTHLLQELTALKDKHAEADMVRQKLQQEKLALEEDIFQLESNLPRHTLKYKCVGANAEWEAKWEEYVREEKKKRVVLISRVRTLNRLVEDERRRRTNAIEEATENVSKEVRATMYQQLQADWRAADSDANRLHSELQDERVVMKQLRADIADMQTKLQAKSVSGSVYGKDHSCQYKLDHFSVQRQLQEAKEEHLKRVSQYEETVHSYQDRLTRMKNEMRRLQNLNSSIDIQQQQFKEPEKKCTPNHTENPTGSNSSGCGSMFGGNPSAGIVDHYKVVFMEGENQRLQKEVDKYSGKLGKVEKENRSLKDELNRSRKLKEASCEPSEPSQPAAPRHPLGGINKAAECEVPEVSTSCVSKEPRFNIPDLKPRKDDNQLIVDGINMQEEANNCKSQ